MQCTRRAACVQDTKALLELEIEEANQAVVTLRADVKELAASMQAAQTALAGAKKEWKDDEKDLTPDQQGTPPLLQ